MTQGALLIPSPAGAAHRLDLAPSALSFQTNLGLDAGADEQLAQALEHRSAISLLPALRFR